MARKYQLHGAFPSQAGDSAYQVAQKNGFEGTEQEWLASLVGKTAITPHIGENGNWWFSEEDTGIPSRGEDGKDAPQEAVLFIPQELTPEQKAQARQNIGSSSAFYISQRMDQAVSGFSIELPTTFGNILQFNVHITLGKVEQEFQIVSMHGGKTAGASKINAGNDVGVNCYCLRGYSYDDIIYFSHSVTQNTVESGAAVPVTTANQPRFTTDPNKNTITYYSNTDGVLIPEGTRIEVWGVCI